MSCRFQEKLRVIPQNTALKYKTKHLLQNIQSFFSESSLDAANNVIRHSDELIRGLHCTGI